MTLTNTKLQEIAIEFESVINKGCEETIHQFLAKNVVIFSLMYPANKLWSKFRLGTAYTTDFILVGRECTNDIRPRVTMIEIERSDKKIFTVKGDPAAILTHAVRQVQDWKQWVSANRDYVARDILARWTEGVDVESFDDSREQDFLRERLLHHFTVYYYVIVGRRNKLHVPELLRLAQMNDDLANIRIITYDTMLDRLLKEATR